MPSRKKLRAVAHNVGDSFMSPMNLVPIPGLDWLGNLLLDRAFHTHTWSFSVDLPSCQVSPASFSFPELEDAARRYITFLRGQIQKQGLDPSIVTAATISVTFEPTFVLPVSPRRASRQAPYECTVSLTDDQGHVHTGVCRGWSYVPSSLSMLAPGLFRRFLTRLRAWAT